MIVRDIMTTDLVTVSPDDRLGHACKLFRQHQFHHLPVARASQKKVQHNGYTVLQTTLFLEGLVTSQAVESAITHAQHASSSENLICPWPEQRIVEVMDFAPLCVTPMTDVGTAAHLLVTRGLSCLPVVEYRQNGQESRTILVGLLTRSDLLIALARAMGTFEPGMPLDIELPMGNMLPLSVTLRIASELHIPIRSIVATPGEDGVPLMATLRLGTINPGPVLERLHEAGIKYVYATPFTEEMSKSSGDQD